MSMYRMVPERNQPDGWKILDLGGVPVYVDTWFFLYMGIIFFLYHGSGLSASQAGLACFVIFFSLLAHELGHAFMARSFRVRDLYVRLTFFQGFASHSDRLSRGQSLAVVIAGPTVTLLLYLGAKVLLILGLREVFPLPEPLFFVLAIVQLMNGLWFVFNILPIYPMDGGQILYYTLSYWKLSASALLITAKVSLVACVLAGLWGLQRQSPMMAIFCFQFFMNNLQIVQAYRGGRW